MWKIWITVISLCLTWLAPAWAGTIDAIRVARQSDAEITLLIEGTYDTYQAIGLQDPARFAIDLLGAQLKPDVERFQKVDNPLVSSIQVGDRPNGLRVMLFSEDPKTLFRCQIEEKPRVLLVVCRPAGAPPTAAAQPPAAATVPATVPATVSATVTGDVAPDPEGTVAALFGPAREDANTPQPQETKKVINYVGENITLDFYKTDIHNVFRLFAEISGKNVIVDDRVTGEVTLSLKEVPWDLALEIILEVKGLTIEEKLNTMIVKPLEVKSGGAGDLVVRRYSEETLQPARLQRKQEENLQRAQGRIEAAARLEALDRPEEALAAYLEAYELDRSNLDVLKKIAYLNYMAQAFAKSYFFAGEVLKLNPRDADGALYAALSAARMGRNDAAARLFDIATTEASPQMPEAFYNYALFLEKEQDLTRAAATYQRYEQLFGPSLDVSLALARLLEAQGRTTEACRQYMDLSFAVTAMAPETRSLVQEKIQTLCRAGVN